MRKFDFPFLSVWVWSTKRRNIGELTAGDTLSWHYCNNNSRYSAYCTSRGTVWPILVGHVVSTFQPLFWRRGGGGCGRIRRKGALEHRTLDLVTLQQEVKQREREVWTQKVWRPLLKYVNRQTIIL
jgi:hypothetical protein